MSVIGCMSKSGSRASRTTGQVVPVVGSNSRGLSSVGTEQPEVTHDVAPSHDELLTRMRTVHGAERNADSAPERQD